MGNHGRLADLTVSKEALRKMEPGVRERRGRKELPGTTFGGLAFAPRRKRGAIH